MYNPFSTTFGMEPNNFIQRIEESKQIISEFNDVNPSNYVYLITGVRGSGKTVFLSHIANTLSQDDKWLVIDPGPKDNLLENIASELYEAGRVKHLFLKTEFNFSFQGITFSIKGENPVVNVLTLIKKMLEYLKKKGKRVLVTIDEVDNSNEMKYFIQAYQSLIRQNYPILLLMTGLYDNVSKLQDDKSLTFLYRAPKIQLGSLSLQTIASKYREYLNSDDETSIKLAKLTKGYAYAYQVLGYILYKNNTTEINSKLFEEYDQYLSEYVYEKLYSELSMQEKNVVLAFNSDDKVDMTELRLKTNLSTKELSVYRNRLIRKGIIKSISYGFVEFTLPRFNEFLKLQ